MTEYTDLDKLAILLMNAHAARLRDGLVQNVQQKIDRLQAQLDVAREELKQAAAEHDKRISMLEEELKLHVLICESKYEGHGFQVTYRSGYERVSYSPQAVENFLAKNESLRPLIQPLAKTTAVDPSVTLKMIGDPMPDYASEALLFDPDDPEAVNVIRTRINQVVGPYKSVLDIAPETVYDEPPF